MGQLVFFNTATTSRGGLYSSFGVLSKESILQKIERQVELSKQYSYRRYSGYRYGWIDGGDSQSFKDMRLNEFEEIFTPEDIERMGDYLTYQPKTKDHGSFYPVFRKEIYMKHGIKRGENE